MTNMANSTITTVELHVDETADPWHPSGPCRHCGVREATQWYVADGGMMAFVHGCGQAWCESCIVAEQIAYCEKEAVRIAEQLPKLRLAAERLKLVEMLAHQATKLDPCARRS